MSEQPILHEYDAYISRHFAPEDAALTTTRDEMKRENIPSINVSASEGKLLHLLVLMSEAHRSGLDHRACPAQPGHRRPAHLHQEDPHLTAASLPGKPFQKAEHRQETARYA